MRFGRQMVRLLLASAVATSAAAGHAAELRYALADDPDALDPVTNRTAAGVAVLTAMCDKLVNIDSTMISKPGLAKSWTWSTDNKNLTMDLIEDAKFSDGTPLDAAAVKFNLDRAKAKGSLRADDAGPIESVEVLAPYRIVVHLSAPNAALIGKFAERLGMIMSPKAIAASGDNFGRQPVCSGPYRFTERVAQDRIVVDKVADYRNAKDYSFDRITFRIIPDDSVRLTNLQSGDIDLMEKLDPSSASVVAKNSKLRITPLDTLNYQSIVINVAGKYGELPMGKDPKVREAFDAAIDRQALVDVAFAGQYAAGNQFAPPSTPYYDKSNPVPARDPDKAKALLKAAGYTKPVPFTLLVPNRPLPVRVAEMIQAMTSEVGFDTKLQVVDFATTLNMTDSGNFEAWGPIGPQFANDPDSITYMSLHSTGNRNVGKFKDPIMDQLMDATRLETDPLKRQEDFRKASAEMTKDRSLIYLYHQRFLFASKANLTNIHATGDAFILFDNMKLQ